LALFTQLKTEKRKEKKDKLAVREKWGWESLLTASVFPLEVDNKFHTTTFLDSTARTSVDTSPIEKSYSI
jgi:hypothetical protein